MFQQNLFTPSAIFLTGGGTGLGRSMALALRKSRRANVSSSAAMLKP